ncbi:hypothetical protein EGW08_012562 [Elysia chlorotica]|uniref:Uncharacterized protein n=1 Tax=Elysia chlorotica TaxID=188477 RepID=A0A3S0ZIH5_ELYCH|nr:hypothetical protein EGW08_012562 [Elysia chlorotica]
MWHVTSGDISHGIPALSRVWQLIKASDSTVNILSNNVEITACLDMSMLTSGVKYKYYHGTIPIPISSSSSSQSPVPGAASTSTSSSSGSSMGLIIGAAVGGLIAIAAISLLVYMCVFKGLWLAMPCSRGKKDAGKVTPHDEKRQGKGQPEVPTDAKATGLTATAITTPGRGYSEQGRWLDTAQSTRSAITPSNLQTDLVLEEQKPRRLPALLLKP